MQLMLLFKTNTSKNFRNSHGFHLLELSKHPRTLSFWIFNVAVSFLGFMQEVISFSFFLWALILLAYHLYDWFLDVIMEATIKGHHTKAVQRGLALGTILFIFSEVMFFFSFFWAYYHFQTAPSVAIGCVWPPKSILVADPLSLPLLNTLTLLLSGFFLNEAHKALVTPKSIDPSVTNNRYSWAHTCIGLTLLCALYFTFFQVIEYNYLSFSMCDNVYGSIFFLATGFHGMHVLIGSFFIESLMDRTAPANNYKILGFTWENHFGFEAAAWYWHFVDVVWLFLYYVIYPDTNLGLDHITLSDIKHFLIKS